MRSNKVYLVMCALLILIVALVFGTRVANASGIDAQFISEVHQRHQECQYSERVTTRRPADGGFYCRGRVPGWRTDHTHEWRDYRQQANQLRAYLYALTIAAQRASLVARWSGVADCESGGNWAINTGNGYYGGLQFSLGTWAAYGGSGRPDQQPAWYQATIADRVRTQSGLHHWPVCGSRY